MASPALTRQWAFDHRSLYTTLAFGGQDHLCRLVSSIALAVLEKVLKDGSVENDSDVANDGA